MIFRLHELGERRLFKEKLEEFIALERVFGFIYNMRLRKLKEIADFRKQVRDRKMKKIKELTEPSKPQRSNSARRILLNLGEGKSALDFFRGKTKKKIVQLSSGTSFSQTSQTSLLRSNQVEPPEFGDINNPSNLNVQSALDSLDEKSIWD